MTRILRCGLVGLTGLVLSGCPIYPHEYECFDNYDCPRGTYCNDNNVCVLPPSGTGGSGYAGTGGGAPGGVPCNDPGDCAANEVCGSDGTCHPGDCYFSGCVAGYDCVLVGQQYSCLPQGGTGGSGGSGGDASAPVYCGNPADCASGEVCGSSGTCQPGSCTDHGCVNDYVCDAASGACEPESSASCMLDSDCASLGAGYKCVSGACTAPADQCTDGTQCPAPSTQSCVEGKCIQTCDDDSDCGGGWGCDTTLGICTEPATGCAITNDCGSANLVCVAGACVQKCGPGGTCASGLVCVANGCVPDQSSQFLCDAEGQQGSCLTGSICLHHSCYIACTPDPDSCAINPPDLGVCKPVTTASGSYNVCGSLSNLGSECDPTTGNACTGGDVCIDGFCR